MGQQHRRGDFTEVSFRLSINPQIRSWESQEIALPSNESAVISPYYSGPPIEAGRSRPLCHRGFNYLTTEPSKESRIPELIGLNTPFGEITPVDLV